MIAGRVLVLAPIAGELAGHQPLQRADDADKLVRAAGSAEILLQCLAVGQRSHAAENRFCHFIADNLLCSVEINRASKAELGLHQRLGAVEALDVPGLQRFAELLGNVEMINRDTERAHRVGLPAAGERAGAGAAAPRSWSRCNSG